MTGTAREFAASGVVTLTTDFVLKDPFVGVMKGRLVEGFPAVRSIDLTHEIPAHWPAEAGFWLSRSFRYFPVGTVHVAVVDPGVGGARAIAVVEAEGHLFLAPDNGLLAPVVESASVACARHVSGDALLRLGVDGPSATFHGRDVLQSSPRYSSAFLLTAPVPCHGSPVSSSRSPPCPTRPPSTRK